MINSLLSRGMPFSIYTTHLLAAETVPFGINASGDIVGGYSSGYGSHGFLYRARTYTTLDVPGMEYTTAYGINDLGHIIGTCQGKTAHGYKTHGFFYTNGLYATFDCPLTTSWTTAHINAAPTGDIIAGK